MTGMLDKVTVTFCYVLSEDYDHSVVETLLYKSTTTTTTHFAAPNSLHHQHQPATPSHPVVHASTTVPDTSYVVISHSPAGPTAHSQSQHHPEASAQSHIHEVHRVKPIQISSQQQSHQVHDVHVQHHPPPPAKPSPVHTIVTTQPHGVQPQPPHTHSSREFFRTVRHPAYLHIWTEFTHAVKTLIASSRVNQQPLGSCTKERKKEVTLSIVCVCL